MMSDQFSPDAAGDIGLRSIPVTVIGGGIGGLSVALSLLDAGAVAAADITIVDASPGSGKLHTYTSRLGHVCELGAGRYSPRLHPRLDALVTRFGIDTAPHVFTIKYQSGQAEADEFSGFTGLVDALRDYLVDQGVTMLHSTRLVAAETCPQGLDLEFLTSDRRRLHRVTEQVVLAIPPAELLSLRLPVHPKVFGWLPDLVTVPLLANASQLASA
jgi:protoporphyrinogen oxidase